MKPLRVWVTRDHNNGRHTWVWSHKPNAHYGQFIYDLDDPTRAGFKIPPIGLKPGEIREFRLVPVAKKKKGGRRR